MAETGKKDPQDHPEKKGGTGPNGTIPESEDGVGATSGEEASHFEPEEDADSTKGDGA